MPIRTNKSKKTTRIQKFIKSFKDLSKAEKALFVGTLGATALAGAPGFAAGTATFALLRTTKVPTTKRKKRRRTVGKGKARGVRRRKR